MWKQNCLLLTVFLMLSGCNCAPMPTIRPIQAGDKKLACKEIILEINEAEEYRNEANRKRGIGMGEILMPTCWVTGYIDGGQIVKAANARINYLGKIYDLLDCGGRTRRPPPPPRSSVVPPKPYPPQTTSQAKRPQAPSAPRQEQQVPIQQSQVQQPQINPESHIHIDRKSGTRYTHSHYHQGKHRHGQNTIQQLPPTNQYQTPIPYQQPYPGTR